MAFQKPFLTNTVTPGRQMNAAALQTAATDHGTALIASYRDEGSPHLTDAVLRAFRNSLAPQTAQLALAAIPRSQAEHPTHDMREALTQRMAHALLLSAYTHYRLTHPNRSVAGILLAHACGPGLDWPSPPAFRTVVARAADCVVGAIRTYTDHGTQLQVTDPDYRTVIAMTDGAVFGTAAVAGAMTDEESDITAWYEIGTLYGLHRHFVAARAPRNITDDLTYKLKQRLAPFATSHDTAQLMEL